MTTPARLDRRVRGLRSCAAGWLAGALAALLLPLQANAQRPAPDSVIPIESLVVTGTRTITTAGGASAVVISPDSLLPAVPVPTLDEVLRRTPFVGVRENSRGEAEITIRGSESRQVAVLLDGIPLTLSWDSRTDPSLIPLTGARSLVLVRGLHSVMYGPNVLGGVVEVGLTDAVPSLEVPSQVRFRAGIDHLGGSALGAVGGHTATLEGGILQVRAGAGFRDRSGFALPGGLRDTLTRDSDLRANSDLRHYDGFLAGRYLADGGQWLRFSASGYTAERGVPPELHVVEPRLWRYPEVSRLLAAASAGTGQRRTPFGLGDVEASLGLDLGHTDTESFTSAAYDVLDGTEAGDDRTLTARLLADHLLGGHGILRGAFTFSEVNHDERVPPDPEATYRQRLWSLGSEVALSLPGTARLDVGLVWDGADTPETGGRPALGRLDAWGGRLGVSTLALEERLRLHASLNRRSRFPALRELYSGALGRFIPNPNLKPETLVSVEAGATADVGPWNLQAVGFQNRLFDAVARVTENRMFRRINREEIRSTGMELLADWERGGWKMAGDLTLQEVQVFDSLAAGGEALAEHVPEFRTTLDARVPLPLELTGLLNAAYTGKQFCEHPDLGSTVELEGTSRVDAGLERSWRVRRGGVLSTLRTAVAVDNVGDQIAYDQCGLPQLGRTLRFTIEIG